MRSDLDRFVKTSGRVDLSDVAWERARDVPLDPDGVRLLSYMMDIESHTVIFPRDLLATRAAFDASITAFLSCWNYEENWHGEAFSRLLGESGISLAPDHGEVAQDDPYPSRARRIGWIRRNVGARGYVSHLGTLLGSALTGQDFIAIHMTWGMVNELTTASAYRWMIDRTRNVPLAQVLQAITKQERRHFAFYRSQAGQRLARSPRARRMVRRTLDHLWPRWGPASVPSPRPTSSSRTCSTTPTGSFPVKELDDTVAALPGLHGTSYLQRAVREAAARRGVPVGMGS